ncbi:hypothetical protein SCP_0400400 [Sparassis crispa]|uniref:Uncharacterized protein n=1 Tax=Sparassis crispa TaxID=139825 RepID=A0A401GHM8_9APHY|nr:hypothetical protein SCP_0400400 [Sparassis crispa]GBE81669.1 hypothetical protein SCP_0400400 [Sparassis crispa]
MHRAPSNVIPASKHCRTNNTSYSGGLYPRPSSPPCTLYAPTAEFRPSAARDATTPNPQSERERTVRTVHAVEPVGSGNRMVAFRAPQNPPHTSSKTFHSVH